MCFPSCRPALAVGNAFDLILVKNSVSAACSDTIMHFGPSAKSICGQLMTNRIFLEIEDAQREIRFPIVNNKIRSPGESDTSFIDRSPEGEKDMDYNHDKQALLRLASLLKSGRNQARYLLMNEDEDCIIAIAPCNIFLFSDKDRLFVVDIDGTITRSNVRGVLDTLLTERYSYIHDGVCQFLSSLENVKMLYLTSRPIGIANATRKFLSQVRQSDDHQLPDGPLLGFKGSMAEVLMMELVSHSVHEFKASTLTTHVVQPFRQVGVNRIFVAGVGNSLMDMQAYHAAGMEPHQMYMIDKQSTIYCLDKGHEPNQQDKHEYMSARGTVFQ